MTWTKSGLNVVERGGDLPAKRASDRNRDREVTRRSRLGDGNIAGEGQLVAALRQAADQLARFGRHAARHEAGDVAHDEDPHQPRRIAPLRSDGALERRAAS